MITRDNRTLVIERHIARDKRLRFAGLANLPF